MRNRDRDDLPRVVYLWDVFDSPDGRLRGPCGACSDRRLAQTYVERSLASAPRVARGRVRAVVPDFTRADLGYAAALDVSLAEVRGDGVVTWHPPL